MQVSLTSFEGPIDLLVYLVQKNEMDIKNIRISDITEQYLEIIQDLSAQSIENASEFMSLAATLIYLKSKSLLPEDQQAEEVTEANTIREELIRKIHEFQTYKELSRKISEMPWRDRDFFIRPVPELEVIKEMAWAPIDMTSIVTNYQKCLSESRRTLTMVKREYKSIGDRVAEISDILRNDPNTEFSSLLSPDPSIGEVVITFISLLELARLKFVELSQEYGSAIKITLVRDLSEMNLADLTGFDRRIEKPKEEEKGKVEEHEQVG